MLGDEKTVPLYFFEGGLVYGTSCIDQAPPFSQ